MKTNFVAIATATMLAGILYTGCSSNSGDDDDAGGGKGGKAATAGTSGKAGAGGKGSGGSQGGAAGKGTGGGGGSASGGAGGGAGAGGSASGGSAGNAGGAGSGGTAGGAGAGGQGGMAGAAAKPTAVATIAGIEGGTIKGTATFTQDGNDVTVVIELTDCPTGKHGIHIHEGTGCANRTDQGMHWGPTRGEGIGAGTGEITCDADKKASLTYKRTGAMADLKWNIGAPTASDIVGHPVVVHGLVSSERHGCGVIMKK